MRKFTLSFISLLTLLPAFAQTSAHSPLTPKYFTPRETTIYHRIGERNLELKTFQYGDNRDLVYINLHDDEMTAVNGARKLLEKYGGLMIKIENYRTRNIRFKLEGKYYTFDPNRMFSRAGIIQSLTLLGRSSTKAIDEVEKFGLHILQLIPANASCIIALHNNSNGKYSINSYLPGNMREKDAKQLFKNPEEDPDDIFLTTDSILFRQLAGEKKYNTIWQDNEKAKKDGSLSIYCGERNIRYINCETEHGKQEQYDEMIARAVDYILGKRYPEMESVAYSYRLMQAGGHYTPKTNTDILFGNRKIGRISSVMTDTSWSIVGKLDIDKNFPLYSNTDFFLLLPANDLPRLEARVDPTRNGELLDPSRSTINIVVKGMQ